MKSRRTRRDAFTLVEMMVSLAVSTIIVVQVFLVLTTQQNVQASNARMVEAMQDARLVAEMIQADIRMAGYMVPAFAGISNRDGGSSGTDALCISNASAIADSEVSTASGVFERAQLTATLTGVSTSVEDRKSVV